MISVSSEFERLMKTRTDFYCEAEITLANGDTWSLSADDFSIANNAYTDGAGASAIPLGEAICRSIELELINDDDRYINTDFYGASILLGLSFKLSSKTETIVLGTFTVTEPETYGVVVSLTAVDDMYKADKTYTTSLTFPASLQSMFLDICDQCDIAYNTATFANSDFLVTEKPSSDYTFRQVLGYIAQIAGGNARINRQGYLEILSYDFETIDNGECHYLTDWISLTVATSDITVTGIQTTKNVTTTTTDDDGNETTETAEETVLYGSEGYVLTVSNPLISGQEEDALPLIGAGIMDYPFRIFSGEYIAYPLAEFMDCMVFTDRKGNTYQSFITDMDFTFYSSTTMSNSAESSLRNASTYNGSGTNTLIAAKKLVDAEKTARETAMAAFEKQIAAASGMYVTAEEQDDGSTIYYLHDKPTLAESSNVIKITSEGIAMSTDGGKTYPYGYTVTGEMIASILSTEGINADWINTGSLVVKDSDGNILLYASPGENTFYVNSEKFTLTSEGVISAVSGAIGGWTLTDGKLYAGNEETGVAAVQTPGDNMIWVFAAGGSSHSSYGDCPFRVSKAGAMYATSGNISGLTLAESYMTAEAQYDYPTFTSDELTTVQTKIQNKTLTDDEIEYYDVNMDGEVDSADLLAMQKMINGSNDTYSKTKISINASSPKEAIKVEITEGYRAGSETTIGIRGVTTENLRGTNLHVSSSASLPSDSRVNGFEIPQILTGNVTITAAANSITEQDISFGQEFGGTPQIFLSIYSATTSANYGYLTPMFANHSSTGFTLRVANAYSSSFAPSIRWMAIYQP